MPSGSGERACRSRAGGADRFPAGHAEAPRPGNRGRSTSPARPLKARYQAKARELGVGERTVERWAMAYRQAGEAGLVDTRMLRGKASAVDPRWDEAVRLVLAEMVSQSTPTRSAVLRKVAARLDDLHGAGVVPRPSAATAYRRLAELARGTNAVSGSARAAGRSRTGPGGLRAAAGGAAGRVRDPGHPGSGRVRDGAGHLPVGARPADRGAGPVHPLHHRAAGHPGVDQGGGRGRASCSRRSCRGPRRKTGRPRRAGPITGCRSSWCSPRTAAARDACVPAGDPGDRSRQGVRVGARDQRVHPAGYLHPAWQFGNPHG